MTNIIIKSECDTIYFYANGRNLSSNDDKESLNCYFQLELEKQGIYDLYEKDFIILENGKLIATNRENKKEYILIIKDDKESFISKEIIKEIFPLANFY